MADASGVESCSGADAFVEGDVAEEMHPDAAGGGVGDAHLTDADDVAALVVAVVHQLCARLDGLFHLLLAHGRLVEEVLRAPRNLAVDDAFHAAEVVVYADIHDAQLEAMLTAEHVDTAAAAREVDHLLPGDVAGTDAHALTFDAVVAAQQQVAGMAQLGTERLLHQTYLHGQFLQPAQRAFGLVQVVYLLLDGRRQSFFGSYNVELSHRVSSLFVTFRVSLPVRLFYLHRDAAHHEHHLVGLCGHILVHPSLQVGEASLDGVVAHAAAAYLVGHEDEGGVLLCEPVELVLQALQRFVHRWLFPFVGSAVEEEVGAPERDAVHHHHASFHLMLAQPFFLLDV